MNSMQHTRANSFNGVVHSRRASAITDKSPNHDNHDSYGFWPDGRLLMVADGVSSDPWAKDASEAAVLGALQARGSMGDRFRAAQAHCRKEAPGSGTTLVAAYLRTSAPLAIFRGVGDSQGFVLHHGGHMTVALDLDNDGNFLRRWIGDGRSFGHDVEVPVQSGEWVMLCSDGLDGYVPRETIRGILDHYHARQRLGAHQRREMALRALLSAARSHGSQDDVTILIGEV